MRSEAQIGLGVQTLSSRPLSREKVPGKSRAERFEEAFEFAMAQVMRLVKQHPDYFPMYTVGGKWGLETDLWTNWCQGFFPGMMWLIHEHTKNRWFLEQAQKHSSRVENRKYDTETHDFGFLFLPTYAPWYRHTGDPALRDVLVEAARTMARRFQKGGYVCSFMGPESLLICVLMNVEILLWVAQEIHDERMKEIAITHARTVAAHLIRPDGSIVQEALFDAQSGVFLRNTTHQGIHLGSCWARGLTWGIYAFGMFYKHTGDAGFLELAKRCARYYLSHVPPGMVPWWDFDLTEGDGWPRLHDSSAAASAARGFFQLSELTSGAESLDHGETALRILDTLTSSNYLAIKQPDWEGVLMHGVYHIRKKLGVDESLIFGDYFFLDALLKGIKRISAGG